jgi:PAS domain S-box-containing protein
LLRASALDQLIGKSVLDFSPAEYTNVVEQRILRLDQEGIVVSPTEEKIICLDGTLIDVEVTGISLNYNGNPSYLMMVHDVTSRKQAEEALRLSEEMYRLIADNMQDLIGVLDINGVVQYASPSHGTVLGFLPEVYEGNTAFDMVHPEDVPHIQQQFANMVLAKEPCYVQFRYKHSNGDWVHVEAKGTPVLDENGEVNQLVVVARDITERKKAEEYMLKSERISVAGQLAAGRW